MGSAVVGPAVSSCPYGYSC